METTLVTLHNEVFVLIHPANDCMIGNQYIVTKGGKKSKYAHTLYSFVDCVISFAYYSRACRDYVLA